MTTKTHIPTTRPRFKNLSVKSEIARVERKPEKYTVYEFPSRTFTKEDKPGKRPT
jgi:hypothetical protein